MFSIGKQTKLTTSDATKPHRIQKAIEKGNAQSTGIPNTLLLSHT